MIEEVRVGTLVTPLKRPFRTALRTVSELVETIVAVRDSDGLTGFGAAPPTAGITGETSQSIQAALKEYLVPAVLESDSFGLNDLLDTLHGTIPGNSSAKAALDIALHDLWSRRMGAPLLMLFGGDEGFLFTDMTISVDLPAAMAREAESAVEQGFRVLKVKVGLDADLDIARLEAVRTAVGEEVVIRIDANQGWTPQQAVQILDSMSRSGIGIEFCEQPVAASDLDGMAYVRQRVSIPIMADESVHGPEDALEVIRAGAADYINIKLMKAGGLRRARHICDIADMYGVKCMIGCMMEGPVSAAAAAHLAAGLTTIHFVDLDGPLWLKDYGNEGGAIFDGPEITLGDSPGLGVESLAGVEWN